jgi:hypothetical protein
LMTRECCMAKRRGERRRMRLGLEVKVRIPGTPYLIIARKGEFRLQMHHHIIKVNIAILNLQPSEKENLV